MSASKVRCAQCKKSHLKDNREINRNAKLGRLNFCCSTCSAIYSNRDRKKQALTVRCPCGKEVHTDTGKWSRKHCSRGCAAKYSVTEKSRAAARLSGLKSTNLWSPSQVLRSREAWKYKRLAKYLKKRNRPHKFEYRLSNRVFDLALLDTQTLVEFDGKYHCGAQLKDDRKKDRLARKHGFEVVRLPDTSSEALSPSLLRGL